LKSIANGAGADEAEPVGMLTGVASSAFDPCLRNLVKASERKPFFMPLLYQSIQKNKLVIQKPIHFIPKEEFVIQLVVQIIKKPDHSFQLPEHVVK
jgi:hypothetical protein